MKKNFLYLISFFVVGCFSLHAKDTIEESIANLQPEVLQSILSHNLLMKAEDKAKYLSQAQALIKDIEEWESNIGLFSPTLKCLLPARQNKGLAGVALLCFSLVSGANVIFHVRDIIKNGGVDNNPDRAAMALCSGLASYFCFFGAVISFVQLSPKALAFDGYKGAYMIKGLLEKVETSLPNN
jgi:hypothetical protein